jgi:uncharacterized protein (TIGR03435 family)
MRAIVLSIAAAGIAFAPAEFEVASIRLAIQDGPQGLHSDQRVFRAANVRVKQLMAFAYDVDVSEIFGGPTWMHTDGYDINAKIPDEFATDGTLETLRPMIQRLLADRFQLALHREPRRISGYALVAAKKEPKIAPVHVGEKAHGMHTKDWHLVATGTTMPALARYLCRYVDKLVVDKTGLPGEFSFELDWKPERLDTKLDAPSDTRPSIFTALQEQLGLKLKSAQVPIQAIVIDRAQRPR